MTTRTNKPLFVLLALLSIDALLFNPVAAAFFPNDPNGTPYRVDSDYGPRLSGGFDFHEGIDLNQQGTVGDSDLGHPIYAA